jgi:hypothetical protein
MGKNSVILGTFANFAKSLLASIRLSVWGLSRRMEKLGVYEKDFCETEYSETILKSLEGI